MRVAQAGRARAGVDDGASTADRRAHFQVLLDEAPIALLRGLLDQVGEQATYEKVLENFLRIAGEQKGCRDLSTLLAPPTG